MREKIDRFSPEEREAFEKNLEDLGLSEKEKGEMGIIDIDKKEEVKEKESDYF